MAATDPLAQLLDRLGYAGLFGPRASSAGADDPWAVDDARARLCALAGDPDQAWLPRFLAAELIFARHALDFQDAQWPGLGEVYATALRENVSGFMSDWGFLHGPQDAGPLGGRWVLLGVPAAPAAWTLLAERQTVPYVYPPQFPSRIRTDIARCDFALLYLAKIHRLPIAIEHDDRARDANIRYLEEQLR